MAADLLNRSEAPLAEKEWEQIDRIVVQTARKMLVGRRFIHLTGPLGIGVQSVPNYVFTGTELGRIGTLMEADPQPVRPARRFDLVLPVIYKDFWLLFRDIETSRQFGIPHNLSSAAAAAAFVAQREDDLIFNGSAELGQDGLTTLPDRRVLDLLDWGEPGNAFQNAVGAVQDLVASGFFGPFAMIVNPGLFAKMTRVFANTGVLEIEQVRKIMSAGVFQTPVLADNVALAVSTGPQNFDLLVGQDFSVAYLSQQDLNHPFRVLESLVLRIHRPGAIVTLEAGVPKGESETRRRRAG